jgi:serine/threonine protein kinase
MSHNHVIGDRYDVEHELGSGGFGTTYAAIDRDSGQRVAVKILDLSSVDDWKAVELFEREAQVLQSLDHDAIPDYVEFVPMKDEQQAYLVQELAPGRSLDALLEVRRFDEAELVDLTRRLLQILRYLGEQHPVVVHRDIKPANILLDDDGAVSLVDFGAVRAVASATMSGGSTVAGTFGYMAPEQLQGVAQPNSDLYGVGMTLVHLATGRIPSEFEKKRLKPDFREHVHFSDAFEQFIDRLIEPVPDDRFETAADALRALERLHDDDELQTREAALRDRLLSSSDHPPSSQAIARMRARAEEEEEEEADKRADKRRQALSTRGTSALAKRDDNDRVTLVEDDEGILVTIRPERRWRGREAHLGLMTAFGFPIFLAVGGIAFGPSGAVAGIATTLVMAFLIWWSAPDWHLRATKEGDFIFYGRNARSPKWVGRSSELQLDTEPIAHGDRMISMQFDGEARRFLGVTGSDADTIEEARKWLRTAGES